MRLVPMTQSEFDSYLERAVPEYAQAHIQAGDCEPGEALILAQADYASLLPVGLATPGHHLFTLRNAAARALYEECGYRIAGIGMTKVLELPPS